MSASVTSPEVVAFVAAVRRALDDLGAEEIDELTGGLEADLDDALADGASGAGIERFGSAQDYAAELRSAAGLPPRAERGGRRGVAGVGERLRDVRERRLAWLGRQRWWPPMRDFFVVVRPAWWVARAGALAVLVAGGGGVTAGWLLLMIALVVASVQVGRRGLAERNGWLRAAVLLLNVIAVIAVPNVINRVMTPNAVYGAVDVPPAQGIWLDGREVRNIIVYDAQGRPLTDVQLFDENGAPLAVGESARTPLWNGDTSYYSEGMPPVTGTAQVPMVTDQGRPVWNVFPLRQQQLEWRGLWSDNGQMVGSPVSQPLIPVPPQHLVPALVGPSTAQTPSVTPSAAPSPVGSAALPSPSTVPNASVAPSASSATSGAPSASVAPSAR